MKDVEAENDKTVHGMARDNHSKKEAETRYPKSMKTSTCSKGMWSQTWSETNFNRTQHKVNCVLSVINQTIIRECVEAKPFMSVICLSEWLKMKGKTKSRLSW